MAAGRVTVAPMLSWFFSEAGCGEGCASPRGASSAPPRRVFDLIERPSVSRNLRREMGMHNPLRIQLLENIAHIIALVRPILEAVAEQDRSLANQLRRALSSVALNIAEAGGCTAGHRRLRFETARGSLYKPRPPSASPPPGATSAPKAPSLPSRPSIASVRGSIGSPIASHQPGHPRYRRHRGWLGTVVRVRSNQACRATRKASAQHRIRP